MKELLEENKRLRVTIDAYARQVNRLEKELLKYKKVHNCVIIDKSITTNDKVSLFDFPTRGK